MTDLRSWPDGEHSCDVLGPKIKGNPLEVSAHLRVPFNLEVPSFVDISRSYHDLGRFLRTLESKFSLNHLVEGIVFHQADGRRAKIKRKDFPEFI